MYEDWFEPLIFEVRMADGKVIDLYEQTFGRCARTLREQHSLAGLAPLCASKMVVDVDLIYKRIIPVCIPYYVVDVPT